MPRRKRVPKKLPPSVPELGSGPVPEISWFSYNELPFHKPDIDYGKKIADPTAYFAKIDTLTTAMPPIPEAYFIPPFPPMPKPRKKINLYEVTPTHESIPEGTVEVKWEKPGTKVQGLFIGIAPDPRYPSTWVGLMEDWTLGSIYFTLPLALREVFNSEVNHEEYKIVYTGIKPGGHMKLFEVNEVPIS
jgi:hypothetical protein